MELVTLLTWFLTEVISIITNTAFLNNLLLIAFFIIFGYFFKIENDNPSSKLDWADMLLDSKTGKLSITKLGQFFGVVVSNWAIIYLIQLVKPTDAPSILLWMFPMWLAFIGGTYGWAAWLKHKESNEPIQLPEPEKEEKE